MKVICYGIRNIEKEYFEKLNKYNYDLTFVESMLDNENINLVEGHEAVILRANCPADKKNIEKMKEFGVKYLLTRTVGVNHIDIKAAKENGMLSARVPGYSPNAIAELAVTLAMMLIRSGAYTITKTLNRDFTVDEYMFSQEIRNLTVGIIGTGKIGYTAAKLFKGLGAKVLAYDIYENEEYKNILEYRPMDSLLKEADIVSLHCPYIPGKNDYMINERFIEKMKDGSILINTARGELQDIDAIIKALETNKLRGYGTDVLENEGNIFFRNMNGQKLDKQTEKLLSLFPKVLITPHIGSYTDEALSNMIEISYENLNEFIETGRCNNSLY